MFNYNKLQNIILKGTQLFQSYTAHGLTSPLRFFIGKILTLIDVKHIQSLLQSQTINLLPQFCFQCRGHSTVAHAEQTTRRHSWCEPVSSGKTLQERHKMSFEVAGRVLCGDGTKRINGLISHDRLFDCGQAFKRWLLQETMKKIRTQNPRQNFNLMILVISRTFPGLG